MNGWGEILLGYSLIAYWVIAVIVGFLTYFRQYSLIDSILVGVGWPVLIFWLIQKIREKG